MYCDEEAIMANIEQKISTNRDVVVERNLKAEGVGQNLPSVEEQKRIYFDDFAIAVFKKRVAERTRSKIGGNSDVLMFNDNREKFVASSLEARSEFAPVKAYCDGENVLFSVNNGMKNNQNVVACYGFVQGEIFKTNGLTDYSAFSTMEIRDSEVHPASCLRSKWGGKTVVKTNIAQTEYAGLFSMAFEQDFEKYGDTNISLKEIRFGYNSFEAFSPILYKYNGEVYSSFNGRIAGFHRCQDSVLRKTNISLTTVVDNPNCWVIRASHFTDNVEDSIKRDIPSSLIFSARNDSIILDQSKKETGDGKSYLISDDGESVAVPRSDVAIQLTKRDIESKGVWELSCNRCDYFFDKGEKYYSSLQEMARDI